MALVHHRSRWRRCRDDEWLLMLFEGKFTPPVVTGTPRWGVRGMFPFPFHSSSEILLGLSVNSDPEKRKPWSDTPFISRELRLQCNLANGYCVSDYLMEYTPPADGGSRESQRQSVMMSGGRHSSEFSSPPKHVSSLGPLQIIFHQSLSLLYFPHAPLLTLSARHMIRALRFRLNDLHLV